MDINKELEDLTMFIPMDVLNLRAGPAIRHFPENINFLVPSLTLAGDGIILTSLLLIGDIYLCEVRLAGVADRISFDYVPRNTIQNYRIELWTQEIRVGEELKASYEVASITFVHIGIHQTTILTYVGDEREGWLGKLMSAIPVRSMVPLGAQPSGYTFPNTPLLMRPA